MSATSDSCTGKFSKHAIYLKLLFSSPCSSSPHVSKSPPSSTCSPSTNTSYTFTLQLLSVSNSSPINSLPFSFTAFRSALPSFSELCRFRCRVLLKEKNQTRPEQKTKRRIRVPFVAFIDTIHFFTALITGTVAVTISRRRILRGHASEMSVHAHQFVPFTRTSITFVVLTGNFIFHKALVFQLSHSSPFFRSVWSEETKEKKRCPSRTLVTP